jgi:hypothetical protein
MDTKEGISINRRGFISTFSGLASAVLLTSPKRLFARKREIKHLIGNLEIELLEKSKPIKDPSIICNTHGDATRLFKESKGKAQPICTMNHTGKAIWDSCNGENSPRDISQIIHQTYLVPAHQVYVDCITFLARLKSVGAIHIS